VPQLVADADDPGDDDVAVDGHRNRPAAAPASSSRPGREDGDVDVAQPVGLAAGARAEEPASGDAGVGGEPSREDVEPRLHLGGHGLAELDHSATMMRRDHTFGYGFASPTGRMSTWRGFTPFAGPTMPSRSMRSTIFAALL
jgi:hypothetical protein